MLELLLVALTLCAVAAGAALLAYLVARRRAQSERLQTRLRELVGMPELPTSRAVHDSHLLCAARGALGRAGMAPALWQLCALVAAGSLAVGLGTVWKGLAGALLLPLLLGAALWLLLAGQVERRRREVLDQLPGFLEHVLRAVEAGSSVGLAFEDATAAATGPLRELFASVNRQVRHGANLEDALREAVVEIDLRELHMVVLTLRVNQQFGGSIRELLRSVVSAVRERERTRRERGASGAEARVAACLLALVPATVVLCSIAIQPEHLARLRLDPTGRWVLWISVGLQACGTLWLWRLARSFKAAT